MAIRDSLRKSGKVAFYLAFGIAAKPMLKTAELIQRDFRRSYDNLAVLRELAADAKRGIRQSFGNEPIKGSSYAELAASRTAGRKSVTAIYYAFLRRKRGFVAAAVFFASFNLFFLLRGNVNALFSLALGTCLCVEFAWLAEFRLWQLRGKRISVDEKGTFSDFLHDSGSWRGIFRWEFGYGLSRAQIQYRRRLVIKRCGLLTGILASLVAADMHFSNLQRLSMIPALIAMASFLVVLAVELGLQQLRRSMGLAAPWLSPIRPEFGACLQGLLK